MIELKKAIFSFYCNQMEQTLLPQLLEAQVY